jgi:hypothetical protein
MAMRITVLTLGLALAMTTGLAGQALAGDRGGHYQGHKHGHGHRPPAVIVYPAYRPRDHGWHRRDYRPPKAYSPRRHYRHYDDNDRLGVHLYYGRG